MISWLYITPIQDDECSDAPPFAPLKQTRLKDNRPKLLKRRRLGAKC
jgi:hypothetical protein